MNNSGLTIHSYKIRMANTGDLEMTVAPILAKSYVEKREDGYRLSDTRVSLDSIVYSFLDGESPESIAQNFPLSSLEQVYGAIAFYLANRSLIDDYLAENEAGFQQLQQHCREKSPFLYQKLTTAKACLAQCR